jgi:membrane-bound metal-dependent hydrolase YbcI (DUF457 family)
MNTVTHALAPVIIAHVAFSRSKRFRAWDLVAIGVAGALPDLLTPHMTLESRMISWSHGLPFWTAFTVMLFVISLLSKQRISNRLAGIMSLSYLLHLVCDAVSGGINVLYPVKNLIWGAYWVSPVLWIPLDILCLLTCYYLFRFRPLWARRLEARSRHSQHDVPDSHQT